MDIENDLFFFESDHLALKGNRDYCEVLKTIFILSSQRAKAISDYNKICEIKKAALENPLDFLDKLKKNEDLGAPPLMEIAKLPRIDFTKFDVKVPESDLQQIYTEHPVEEKKEIQNIQHQKWSAEEQKRLEELLREYPPEPVEHRRFVKIAKALGTRTPGQVASRVQKYFLKLVQAGLEVPGRLPKRARRLRPQVHKHQRNNHFLNKPTTFFPELIVPVVMDEQENIPGPSKDSYSESPSTSNYLLPTHSQNLEQPKAPLNEKDVKLSLLKRVKDDKLRESSLFQHFGFRCDYCNEEPIVGSRWHCSTCTDSVDYCTDCVVAQMYSENAHPISHKLITIYNEKESSGFDLSDSESTTGSSQGIRSLKDGDDSESDQESESSVNVKKEDQDGDIDFEKMFIEGKPHDISYEYLHSNLGLDDLLS